MIIGEQNSDICFLWYWLGASTQKVSPVAIALMSLTSLFLLFIMWCPIFNNKYNLVNVRCCGNALYFFAMAIFSSRAPLFISGFKKSVWIINEQEAFFEKSLWMAVFCVSMEISRKYVFNLGVQTPCIHTIQTVGASCLYSIRHQTLSRVKFIRSCFKHLLWARGRTGLFK